MTTSDGAAHLVFCHGRTAEFEIDLARANWRIRGAPTRAMLELAAHEDLATTQRYM
jgi:hypothetical protein